MPNQDWNLAFSGVKHGWNWLKILQKNPDPPAHHFHWDSLPRPSDAMSKHSKTPCPGWEVATFREAPKRERQGDTLTGKQTRLDGGMKLLKKLKDRTCGVGKRTWTLDGVPIHTSKAIQEYISKEVVSKGLWSRVVYLRAVEFKGLSMWTGRTCVDTLVYFLGFYPLSFAPQVPSWQWTRQLIQSLRTSDVLCPISPDIKSDTDLRWTYAKALQSVYLHLQNKEVNRLTTRKGHSHAFYIHRCVGVTHGRAFHCAVIIMERLQGHLQGLPTAVPDVILLLYFRCSRNFDLVLPQSLSKLRWSVK